MSPPLATILLLSGCALALAPIALAYRKPRLIAPLLWSYGVVILGTMVSQTGLLPRAVPVAVQAGPAADRHMSSARCDELMALLARQHVVLNSTDPNRLVVNQNLWSQLPQEARDAIVECAGAVRPAVGPGNSIQIVEQPQ